MEKKSPVSTGKKIKKILLYTFGSIVVILMAIGFFAGESKKTQVATDSPKIEVAPSTIEEPIVVAVPSMEDHINALIKSDNLYGVKIDNFTLNNNAAKNDGSKIALINLTWDERNSATRTQQMLEMYSARIVGKALITDPNIQEAVLFWEVPYHQKGQNSAKFNYFKKNNEFYEGDKWYAPVLR